MRTALTACLVLAAMTAAHGSVDLAEILAPPPSADYADAGSSENVLNGAFTAHQYAQWLAPTLADVSAYESAFNQQGFKRGYARSWSALSSTKASPGTDRHNWLIETVEEYGSGSGAQSRYTDVMNFTRGGGQDFVREIETTIPNSFGAVIFSGALWFVMFVKGNDLYTVRMESNVDDMTAVTVQQAQVQFKEAPDYTIAPGQPTPVAGPAANRDTTGKTILFAIVELAAVAAGGVLILLSRRRSST
jgi:hypothetical protein